MRGIQEYRTVALETMPSEDLVTLLYQESLKRLSQAESALSEGDRIEYAKHLTRVRAIFNELLQSLDPTVAPEVVANYKRLYFWVLRELNKAGRQKTPKVLQGIAQVNLSLLETWITALDKARTEGFDAPRDSGSAR